MNSVKVGGSNSYKGAASGNIPSQKGKHVDGSSSASHYGQLNRDTADLHVNSTQEGGWEVIGKKSKNRVGASAGKNSGSSTPASKAGAQSVSLPKQGGGTSGGSGRGFGNNWPQAAGNSCAQAGNYGGAVRAPKSAGRGYSKPQTSPGTWESAYMVPSSTPGVSSPLKHGWQWAARSGSSGSQVKDEENFSNLPGHGSGEEYDLDSDMAHNQPEISDDDKLSEDSDDDLSDDYNSDASQKSHETCKKNKWFKVFFEDLDKLSADEINEPKRQWHCPACQNGPGAIDWYTSLQPLVTHAKTKSGKRAKVHRELAKLIDEELRRRGTSVVPAGEAFGKWRGLRETTTDHEIIWPPMVVVMNTLLQKDENDKWIGMGNQELFEYFSTYAAVKARHSYGPRGHRGMSLLIFEATSMGYHEAERLHKHFSEEGTDRDAWERRQVLFYPGGKRQLYGYLANKEDIENFNQHCHGKSQLKYELKSYQEMVVTSMKQMSEDNQMLVYYKHKSAKDEQRAETFEKTFGVMSQQLHDAVEETRIVMLRTKKQLEENKEEMDSQEQFFTEQMEKIQKGTEEKEWKYEILLQDERAKAKQSDVNFGSNGESRLRQEEIQRFIDSQAKGVEEFVADRETLIRKHEKREVELKRIYLEQVVDEERAFDSELTELMEKYAPSSFLTPTSNS